MSLRGSGFGGPNELCDGAPPPSQSYVDFDYDAGPLRCGNCAPTYDACGMLRWERVAQFMPTNHAVSIVTGFRS